MFVNPLQLPRRRRPGRLGLRRGRVSLTLGALATLAVLLLPGSALARRTGEQPTGQASQATPTLGWQSLVNPPPFNPGAMYLLTDGTVLVQALGPSAALGSPTWWRLTPDSTGSYVNGTWSQAASLPSSYGPGASAAAVLPDGRLAVAGGEYNNGVEDWTNLGAIYDPVANTWTMISPPNGGTGQWQRIGDAPSEVLADGRWIVGASGFTTSTDDAILNPSNLTWTTTGATGKIEGNGEAGFTLLPNGKVLSVDALPPACTTRSTEILDPLTLAWSSAGTTPTPLIVCASGGEIGPQILMYNGDVFVEGWTSATALYNVTSGTWSSGPSFPTAGGQQQNGADAGSALLPNGDVLVATRTGNVQPPTHFYLFNGSSFTQVADNASSANGGLLYMLLLPTGQVLYNGLGSAGFQIFTDPGSPSSAWEPSITSVPTTLAVGKSYTLDGHQLNGLSDGAAFGDDYQSSTDYPLVQITNNGSGTVTYARTWAMANRSIASGAFSCTNFTLPSGTPTGPSELRVVANGIASAPVAVSVGSTGSNTTSCLPTLVAGPVVSGAAGVGRSLTSSPGTWSNATGYAYQWQRCAANGSGCGNISGASASTYTLTSADVGSTLRSLVTASNGNSTAAAVASNLTAVVVPLPAATSPPVVSGKAIVGKTLATTHGAWNATASFAYQWLRCTSSGNSCTPITGASSSTYALRRADAGHRLKASVTATDAAGSTAALSARTALVVERPVLKKKPRIFGKPHVGKRLRASHGTWRGPPAKYKYQWLRCSHKGTKCRPIRRATRKRYRLTKHDAGHRLRVKVVALNAAGKRKAKSPATRVVKKKHHR